MYVTHELNIFEYKHNPFQSIFSIKEDIRKIIKKNDFNILHNGRILDESKTPYDYKIRQNDKIEIKLKLKGGTISRGMNIFLTILVFLILIVILIIGILPFISFLISNIVIKGLKIGLQFFRSLTDQNNWINSFLGFIITNVVPLIKFILTYGALFLVTFFVIFLGTYNIYNLRYNDPCKALKCSNLLAMITTVIICFVYFIFDLPVIVSNILQIFAPGMFKNLIKSIGNNIAKLRKVCIELYWPVGPFELMFVKLMESLMVGLNNVKGLDADLLYNWSRTYQLTQTYPLDVKIKEMGLDNIIQYVNFADAQKRGVTTKEKPMISMKDGSNATFLRWLYDTVLFVILEMIGFLDFCGQNDIALINLEREISDLERMKNAVESALNDKSTNNTNKPDLREALKNMTSMISNLTILKDQKKNSELLNLSCLNNIFSNGAMTGYPSFIIFLILFIIFLFIVPDM